MQTITTSSPLETEALGQKIADQLKPNAVLALIGDLGAGKTTFVKGLAKGLGVVEYVNSPSFVILTEHPGRLPLFHVDFYRLENLQSIEDLGVEEYFKKNGVTVIEWANHAPEILPDSYIEVKFEMVDENERKIEIKEITNFYFLLVKGEPDEDTRSINRHQNPNHRPDRR
jgi:tRNA threonylcarbamoyladenosine biosynthesis protein TsaE